MTQLELPVIKGAADPLPDLHEAKRLLDAGMRLIVLKPYTKRPGGGDGWNKPENFAKFIDPHATGYGLPLQPNKLCSIDPDNWPLACKGMAALGFDLEALMDKGVRTRSTRPGSGGRSAFVAEGEIDWLKFRNKSIGTVLEFRAHSPNLQDCVPGLVYRTTDGTFCTQSYAGDKRLDDAPCLPDELWRWWERCSADLEFQNRQEDRFFKALGEIAARSISLSRSSGGRKLAHPSTFRAHYNQHHQVPDILARHGYNHHRHEKRWSPPRATGAPGVREVPGKVGLWASDHASDPLSGIFDAWTAHVVLDHDGDLNAAEDAYKREQGLERFEAFGAPAPVAGCLETAPEAPQEAPKAQASTEHPLLQFVDLSQALTATRWVIPGVVAQGVVMIAGSWGVGKTTAVLPLSMIAAGLHRVGDPLAPKHWRHVIYITEDIQQARSIIEGMARHGNFELDFQMVQERIHLVEAQRLDADYVAKVATTYRAWFSRSVGGVTVLPLVVFDTRSANFEMEEENSNSEASKVMAILRQRFAELPVWIVGHTAKADMAGTDVTALSSRGGGAWDADATQTMFLIRTGEQRLLKLGKTRFEPRWEALQIEGRAFDVELNDEFGDPEITTLRWVDLTPLTQTDAKAEKLAAKKRSDDAIATALKHAIIDAVQTAWEEGHPLNRSSVKARVGGNSSAASKAIEYLISENWLHEVDVPPKVRVNNKKQCFLIALNADERNEWRKTYCIPIEKQTIPPSWRKPDVSVSSEPEQTAHIDGASEEPQAANSVCSKSVRSPKGKKLRNERRGDASPAPVPSIPGVEETSGMNGNEQEETTQIKRAPPQPANKKGSRMRKQITLGESQALNIGAHASQEHEASRVPEPI